MKSLSASSWVLSAVIHHPPRPSHREVHHSEHRASCSTGPSRFFSLSGLCLSPSAARPSSDLQCRSFAAKEQPGPNTTTTCSYRGKMTVTQPEFPAQGRPFPTLQPSRSARVLKLRSSPLDEQEAQRSKRIASLCISLKTLRFRSPQIHDLNSAYFM